MVSPDEPGVQDQAPTQPQNTSQSGNDVGQMVLFRAEQYKEIGSTGDAFTDAIVLLRNAGITITDAAQLGDGFGVADKATLCGIEMLCLDWKVYPGDYGPMSVCRNVTKDGRKVVIIDGSTGMHAQLADYGLENGGKWPVRWAHGLRRSDFTYTADDGSDKPATTYYIDTAG